MTLESAILEHDAARLAVSDLMERSPQAFELARQLCFVKAIDPDLLRRARRRFAPTGGPACEVEVWMSELVVHRTASVIVFPRPTREILARKLRADRAAYQAAWDFLATPSDRGRRVASATLIEEELFYLQFLGGQPARARSRQLIEGIVHRLQQTDNRADVAYWAEGLLVRLGAGQQKLAADLRSVVESAIEVSLSGNEATSDHMSQRLHRSEESTPAELDPISRPFKTTRAGEAIALGAAGAALGLLSGTPIGLSIPLGAIAGINGVICGWRGIYDWRATRGGVAFVLDSTWAFATTAGALLAHVAARLSGDAHCHDELSRRHNRHVYRRGFQIKPGFAFTVGNVIAGAGDLSSERRRRLITDHENVHVWQARWFGPLYPVLYVGWLIGASAVGVGVWGVRRRREPIAKVVESCAYYLNPFEWWAYSRDDHWPPKGLVAGIGWKRPAVRPFTRMR